MMLPEPTTIVLDASALLVYLGDEPGAEVVEAVLAAASRRQVKVVCPSLCIAEALVVAVPRLGAERIDDLRAAIEQLPAAPLALGFAAATEVALARLAWGFQFPEAAAAVAARPDGAVLLTASPRFAAFAHSGGRVYWIGPEAHRNEPTLFDPLARFVHA